MRALGRRAYTRGRPATVVALIGAQPALAPAPPRLDRPRRPQRAGFWQRWTDRVTRRPVLSAVASARRAAGARHPRALARVRRRRAAPVPRGQRDPRGRRAGGEGARARRLRPDPARGRPSTRAPRRTRATAPRSRAGARTWRADPEVARVGRPQPSRRRPRGAAHASRPGTTPRARRRARWWTGCAIGVAGDGIARVADVQVGGATAAVEDFKDLVSGLDVEDRPVRARVQLPGAVRAAALGVPAAEGGADEPALRGRRLRRARRDLPVRLARRLPRLRVARLHQHDHAAVPAGDRVRPLDGLRGVPAQPDPRALRRHRRHQDRGGRRASPRARPPSPAPR